MAKKTTRAARTGQGAQRTKEDQFRRRMTSQAQRGATSVAIEREEDDTIPSSDEMSFVAVPAPTLPTARAGGVASQARSQSNAAMATAQRRATTATRNARLRTGTETLSMDDEMHYVRSDIRRLIILTAICIAVLIVLAFLIPS